MDKQDKLVPMDENQVPPPQSQVDENYHQAKAYFQDSMVQAAKTNAALITVLGLFVVRGCRYAWEGLCSLFRRKSE
ncbi:MAG: hypothetical protein GX043_07500 [Desulfovibrionales bacterium]|jgi:hypothetical protein|nr:hypothetical protein [Desulfovibrionales bacterium]